MRAIRKKQVMVKKLDTRHLYFFSVSLCLCGGRDYEVRM